MSVWTHVSGNIRIDWLFLGSESEEDAVNQIRESFGDTVTFDTLGLISCSVPCGSEGSLQYKVVINEGSNSISFCNVVIWGDLRDYDDYQEIFDWIKDSCKKFMVRGCAVSIEIEYDSTYLVYGSYGAIKMIEIPRESEE